MTESQRRLTSKRRKVTCSKCNETFNSDYINKHMQKYHPALVKEGKTPSVMPVVETSQSTLSSFFITKSTSDQGHQSSHQQLVDQQLSDDQTASTSSGFFITDHDEQEQEKDQDQQCDEADASAPIQVDELIQCDSPAHDISLSLNSSNTNSNQSDIDDVDEDEEDDDLDEGQEINIDVPVLSIEPNQPTLTTFPLKTFPGKGRRCSFQLEWYTKHPWLEYDIEKDEASCFSCKTLGERISPAFYFQDGTT